MELAAKKAQGPPKEKAPPDKGPRGETRAGPRRRRTRETDANSHRALSETVIWSRGGTRRARAGRVPRAAARHVFAVWARQVLSTTSRPKAACTCPYAVSHPTKVCKRRYFVWYRVLKIPRDDDQRCSEATRRSSTCRTSAICAETSCRRCSWIGRRRPRRWRRGGAAYRRASGDVIDGTRRTRNERSAAASTSARCASRVPGVTAHDRGACGRTTRGAATAGLRSKARICAVCAAPGGPRRWH